MGDRAGSSLGRVVWIALLIPLWVVFSALSACGGAAVEPDRVSSPSLVSPAPPTASAPDLPPLPVILGGASKVVPPSDATLPKGAALNGAWARVFLRANPGPFQYVAYEVSWRVNAGVVSHLRGVMGRRDAIIRTELVEGKRVRRLFARLRDLGALQMPDPGPLLGSPGPLPGSEAKKRKKREARRHPKTQKSPIDRAGGGAAGSGGEEDDAFAMPLRSELPIYELSFSLGGKERTVVVSDPYAQSEPRYTTFLNEVRSFVIAAVGDIPYHEPTGDVGQRGFLFVDSVPGAAVTVDGVLLPDETPVFAYPLSSGVHEVLLENTEHGLSKRYKIRVQPGMTTSLEVDLR